MLRIFLAWVAGALRIFCPQRHQQVGGLLLDKTLFDQLPAASRRCRFRHERFGVHLPVANLEILAAELLKLRLGGFAVGFGNFGLAPFTP